MTFINEIATLCEQVGADAKRGRARPEDRARGSARAPIWRRAARSPAARWRATSCSCARSAARRDRPTPLLDGVLAEQRRAPRSGRGAGSTAELGTRRGATRRGLGPHLQAGHRHAAAIERGRAVPLAARRRAPRCACTIRRSPTLPGELARGRRAATIRWRAARGADALVVATEWPEYRQVDPPIAVAAGAPGLVVLDANRFLGATLGSDPRFRARVALGSPRA